MVLMDNYYILIRTVVKDMRGGNQGGVENMIMGHPQSKGTVDEGQPTYEPDSFTVHCSQLLFPL